MNASAFLIFRLWSMPVIAFCFSSMRTITEFHLAYLLCPTIYALPTPLAPLLKKSNSQIPGIILKNISLLCHSLLVEKAAFHVEILQTFIFL